MKKLIPLFGKIRNKTIFLLIFLITLLFINFACSTGLDSTGNANDNSTQFASITKNIKADSGGTLSDPASGLQLYLSPKALPIDTVVKASSVNVSNNRLFKAAVHFSPERFLMCAPCSVIVPLGASYDGPASLEIWEFNGDDPAIALPSGRYAEVFPGSTGYFAKAEVIHFSGMSFSHVCHSGTIRRILEDFETNGTNRDEIFTNVNKKYTDAHLSNDNIESASPKQVQALLDTYFDDVGGWSDGMELSEATISLLTQYVKNGRTVVLAFGPAVVGERSGTDKFYDCNPKKYRHTAVLQQATDGTVQIVNTVSIDEKMRTKMNMQEIVVEYPLKDINKFRKEKQGVLLELELCGSIGCLSDNTYNPWNISPYNPAEGGVYWLEWGKKSWSERILAIYDRMVKQNPDYYPPREIPWRDVRVYVMRGTGPSNTTNDTAWAEISIEGLYSKYLTPGYCAAAPSDITDGEKILVAGCPSIFLTNGDKIDGMNYDLLTFIFNPQLPGTGTYSVSSTDIVDGGYENILFSTPTIMNFMPAINGPVIFTEQSGTIDIETFGTQIGDRIIGTFDLKIQGKHHIDATKEDILNGTIKGGFNMVIRSFSEIKK